MKLWVGNKRLQGEVSNVIQVHEENSFLDGGLCKNERRIEKQENIGKKAGLKKLSINLAVETLKCLMKVKTYKLTLRMSCQWNMLENV